MIAKLVKVEPDERPALIWSFLYFFCLLCGYYVLRPVRDEMAIQGGVQHIPWMMTGTFVSLLVATPLFGFLSARYRRQQLVPAVYIFFAAHLLLFFLLMASGIQREWVARSFFVWLSIFNLFVVAVFWSLMVDLFSPEQGSRLFGMVAAGGSAGALVGPLVTGLSTYVTGIEHLMIVSMLLLLACLVCIQRLDRWARHRDRPPHATGDRPLGGSMWAGIRLVFVSPYLGGISAYLLLLTTTATFLYMEQARVVASEFASSAERTRLFAGIDLVVNSLTLVTQVFITNRLGLGLSLLLLPLASLGGFALIGVSQTLALLVGFTIVRRIGEYAISKPAREVLFTVVSREEKYKAKNFIDTAVSRGGDVSGSWLVTAVKSLGATTAQIAWVLLPVMLLWSWLGWFLARQQRVLKDGAAPPFLTH